MSFSLYNKYIFKLSKACDSAILALQIVKNAPEKAFEEDINERLKALDTYIRHAQEAKRWLLYFKNKSRRNYES